MDYQKAKLEQVQRQLITSSQACTQAAMLVAGLIEVANDERVLASLVEKNEAEFAAMLEHIRSCMEHLPVQLTVSMTEASMGQKVPG